MNQTKNFAARMGRWSAQHRKKAIFGWLTFVVLSLVIGSAIGVKAPEDDTTFVGESGKAHQLVEEHFPTENVESILIKGSDAGAVRAAADQTVAAVSKQKDVFDVQSPYAKGNEGQIAEDGSVLVNFKLRGDETAAETSVVPVLAAVDACPEGQRFRLRRRVRRGVREQGALEGVRGRLQEGRDALAADHADHPRAGLRRAGRRRRAAAARLVGGRRRAGSRRVAVAAVPAR